MFWRTAEGHPPQASQKHGGAERFFSMSLIRRGSVPSGVAAFIIMGIKLKSAPCFILLFAHHFRSEGNALTIDNLKISVNRSRPRISLKKERIFSAFLP